MPLVAGVDSSTQSCTVVVRDATTGALVRHGRAAHPAGTEVDPRAWDDALHAAAEAAGGLDDVSAIAVGGQQHGVLGCEVLVPTAAEAVADGAARQAAWALSGEDAPPAWDLGTAQVYAASPAPSIRDRYAEAREAVLDRW